MATRKYKSKKHLSKKHGKKSKNHKKHAKKTRKYRKKRGGLGAMAKNEDYLPQYEDILDTLDKIGKGNKSEETAVPGQFGDKDTTMKPTDMLEEYLKMKNTVSCGRRFVIGDGSNCKIQKRKLYDEIITKIQKTRDEINSEKNSSLKDTEVSTIIETLNKAEVHFTSKILSHV